MTRLGRLRNVFSATFAALKPAPKPSDEPVRMEPVDYPGFSFSTDETYIPSVTGTGLIPLMSEGHNGDLVIKDARGVEVLDCAGMKSNLAYDFGVLVKIPAPEGRQIPWQSGLMKWNGFLYFGAATPGGSVMPADELKQKLAGAMPVRIVGRPIGSSTLLGELGRDEKLNAFLEEPDYGVERPVDLSGFHAEIPVVPEFLKRRP